MQILAIKNHKLFNRIVLYSFIILVVACHTQQQVKSTQQKNFKVQYDSTSQADVSVIATIQPYKVKLDSLMNVEINQADQDLKKELPEGALGNMFCDVLMDYTKQLGKNPDFCIMNHGGIRIPVIYKGPIYVRTIFELMPFENQLVLLKLNGKYCKQLFDLIAKSGGAPESGFQMQIQADTLGSIQIASKAFEPTKDYWILTSDYLANGGDKADALKYASETIDLNIKIRDALLLQIQKMKKEGKTLNFSKDGRITKK